VILALSPDDVHLDRLPATYEPDPAHAEAIRRLVLDRGATWAWSSDDPSMSQLGIIGGDPRHATAELGERIVSSALDRCATVLAQMTSSDP